MTCIYIYITVLVYEVLLTVNRKVIVNKFLKIHRY